MANGNLVWIRGDLTGDIYFDSLHPPGREPVPYLRLILMVDGNEDARPVRGLRVLAYGRLAELVHGYVRRGSRIGVEGHIQLRRKPSDGSTVFEVVAERVEFIRNIDFERGRTTSAALETAADGKGIEQDDHLTP